MCVAHWCIIKINKNKNKINLRNHEFVRKKQNGGWKVSDADWFYFSFYDPSPILFYFYFFIRSESIRIDPTLTGSPSWSSPTLYLPSSNVRCPFTSWYNGRRATQLGGFTLWHNRRWASQLASKFALWHNGRRAKQPGLMHAPGVARIFQSKIWRLCPKQNFTQGVNFQHTFERWTLWKIH